MTGKRLFFMAGTALFLCMVFSTLSIAQNRKYLPGDFVHIIVDAPADTSQIIAVMPDKTINSLVQESRTNTWRGIWQVPVDFKKGGYTAKLSAVDVSGNVFEGNTDIFNIGELAVISLVRKTTQEAAMPILESITPVAAPSIITKAKKEGDQDLLQKLYKIISKSTEEPIPEITPATKAELIERNMKTGVSYFEQGRFIEAAPYFRNVLYLDPKNAKAGHYLAESQEKIKSAEQHLIESQEKVKSAEQQRKIILEREKQKNMLAAALIVLSFAAIILFVIVYFKRSHRGADNVLQEKEKQQAFFNKLGWSGNPFAADIIKQVFLESGNLERDGLGVYIRNIIEKAGGKDILPFTPSALDLIYEYSKGNPAKAIKICDWAVRQAIQLGAEQITAEMMKGYNRIGSRSILIVDDDESLCENLNTLLIKGGGFEVDFAVDGDEAIEKIKKNFYGLVFLDIMLPKLSGYEVLKQIRAMYPELPVVFITAAGTSDQTVTSMAKYNLSGYIEKPYTAQHILDTVGRLLK